MHFVCFSYICFILYVKTKNAEPRFFDFWDGSYYPIRPTLDMRQLASRPWAVLVATTISKPAVSRALTNVVTCFLPSFLPSFLPTLFVFIFNDGSLNFFIFKKGNHTFYGFTNLCMLN